jgi:hypothetical protein
MQPDPSAAKSAKAILDYNDRVVKSKDEVIGRIDSFVKFLSDMTVLEMSSLPETTKASLEKSLALVIKMCRSTEEK